MHTKCVTSKPSITVAGFEASEPFLCLVYSTGAGIMVFGLMGIVHLACMLAFVSLLCKVYMSSGSQLLTTAIQALIVKLLCCPLFF